MTDQLPCDVDHPARILFVDLDHTLICSDSLHESLMCLARRRPWALLQLPLWLLKGRAGFKHEISKRVVLDPEALPYRESVRERIETARSRGDVIVLATAAHENIARSVASSLGLFTEVLCSNEGLNLKGKAKLAAMREYAAGREFDYIGDSVSDLPIWEASSQAVVVNPTAGLLKRLGTSRAHEVLREKKISQIRDILKLMRVHQWAKNALILVPLLLSHNVTNVELLLQSLTAFLVFGLCASATYIWNDLLDLPSDRVHATKRNRPLASGRISIVRGLVVSVVLMVAAFGITLGLLPWVSAAMLLGYITLTLTYSLYFKTKLLVDVLILGSFYAYRVMFGAAAIAIPVSPWLIAFCFFLFLSLAFVKRYIELDAASTSRKKDLSNRGYRVIDLDMIRSFGVSTGNISVLILALYLSSSRVAELYSAPGWLWLPCMGLFYWLTRVWFLARRGELPDDPVAFAIGDFRSIAVGVGCAIALLLAMYMPVDFVLFEGVGEQGIGFIE